MLPIKIIFSQFKFSGVWGKDDIMSIPQVQMENIARGLMYFKHEASY